MWTLWILTNFHPPSHVTFAVTCTKLNSQLRYETLSTICKQLHQVMAGITRYHHLRKIGAKMPPVSNISPTTAIGSEKQLLNIEIEFEICTCTM